MNGLLIWIILGVLVYMLFGRRGGMGLGCCGGQHDHNHNDPPRGDFTARRDASVRPEDNVIELKKEDYKVISRDDHNAHQEPLKAVSANDRK